MLKEKMILFSFYKTWLFPNLNSIKKKFPFQKLCICEAKLCFSTSTAKSCLEPLYLLELQETAQSLHL